MMPFVLGTERAGDEEHDDGTDGRSHAHFDPLAMSGGTRSFTGRRRAGRAHPSVPSSGDQTRSIGERGGE